MGSVEAVPHGGREWSLIWQKNGDSCTVGGCQGAQSTIYLSFWHVHIFQFRIFYAGTMRQHGKSVFTVGPFVYMKKPMGFASPIVSQWRAFEKARLRAILSKTKAISLILYEKAGLLWQNSTWMLNVMWLKTLNQFEKRIFIKRYALFGRSSFFVRLALNLILYFFFYRFIAPIINFFISLVHPSLV